VRIRRPRSGGGPAPGPDGQAADGAVRARPLQHARDRPRAARRGDRGLRGRRRRPAGRRVRRPLWVAAVPVGLLTAIRVLLLVVSPHRAFGLELWALAVCGILAVALCRGTLAAAAAGPPVVPFDPVDRLPRPAGRPRDLMALERSVELGCARDRVPENP